MEQIATKKAKEHNDSLDLVENTMDHLLLLIAYCLFSLSLFFFLISRKCSKMEVQKLTRLGLMFMIVSLYLHGLITQFQL